MLEIAQWIALAGVGLCGLAVFLGLAAQVSVWALDRVLVAFGVHRHFVAYMFDRERRKTLERLERERR
jgi:hypothetical protein